VKNSKDPNIKRSGFRAGVLSALVGSATFAVLYVVWWSIRYSYSSLSLIVGFSAYGFLFSAIPAGIGGSVLGMILQNQHRKNTLTPVKGMRIGILMAGTVVIITFGLGIWFIFLFPHASWRYVWTEVMDGTFFIQLPVYVRSVLDFTNRFVPEMIVAMIIACIAGGWTGRSLSRRLLQPNH
jgi:hypothetical protein